MSTTNLSDEVILPEIYFLIAHLLNNSPFQESAQVLIKQLQEHQVLPKRVDWTGNSHPKSFNELLRENSHIQPNFLLQLCNQVRNLFDAQLKINFSQVNSILGAGQFSILQDLKQVDKKFSKTSNLDALPKDLYLKYHSDNRTYLNYSKKQSYGGSNLLLNLERNRIVGGSRTESIVQPELFKAVNIHKRILGHLSSVYCVCFDRTGRYILTGADDDLIKVWSAHDSRLLATLRGHEKEISDIDINFENTLLASGSCDKSIRIWNLKTTEATQVLQGHSAMVTSLEFSPYCRDTQRWLASSGNDGAICFWSWDSKTLVFNPKPRKFIEKSRPGAQMLCISFSAGGSFLAAGSNDHVIRVYYFDIDDKTGLHDPIKVCELESHSNFVDSIQYANTSARFLSGSKDGTAKIWKYENLKWKAKNIDATVTLTKTDLTNSPSLFDICKKATVTMVTWNCDDSLVVTAQNNFLIKVWNSNDAQLIHELKGHTDEIFVLEAHPRDPRLILSSGHDGLVMIWNVLSGKLLRKFYNKIANEGHGCLFDTKWSPTCDMLAATDSHGYLTIFGFGTNERYNQVPDEQFFHTDYRPLMRDSNDFVVDEQTQQPVHLMQPPFLVNADGNPYELEYQRLVPGRENLTDAQLNPHVITNERGLPEIVNMDMDEETQPGGDASQHSMRRNNLYVKNLMSPMNEVIQRTSEERRLRLLNEEEDYFIAEYRKELKIREMAKQSRNDFDFFDEGSNHGKRRRGAANGKRANSGRNTLEGNRLETTIKNRLFTAALFDSDHEEEDERGETRVMRHRVTVDQEHMDEETMDDQYIDIDDNDSNTQHSQIMPGTSNSYGNNPSTSGRANNQRPASSYIEPSLDSEHSDSSEYSDWAQEDGKKTLKPPPRKAQRASTSQRQDQQAQRASRNERSKRRLRIQDDDDDDEGEEAAVEVEESQVDTSIVKGKRTTLSKRLKRIVSDEEEEGGEEKADEDESEEDEDGTESSEEEDEDKPCTSSSAYTRKSTRKGKKSKRKNRNNTSSHSTATVSKSRSFTKSKNKVGRPPVNEKLTECPPEYRPPEWLTSTRPKKSPYVPQMGDEVVYFRQGHELYVNAVKASKAYDLEEQSLPWNTRDIEVTEYCKVIGMKVEIKPPRLVCLKLGIIDEKSGKLTGVKFTIKYHDMAHVVDFVILRQFYEKAIEKNWRPGDRFRSIIDDSWYFGVIESHTPFQEEYPRSYFQCLKILWDSNDKEDMSPWDLEPLSGVNARKTKPVASAAVPENGEGVPVTTDEIKSLLYQPDVSEWPGVGRDYECERIVIGLQKIMELSIAEPFNFPVDLDSFPNYAMFIDYPIDLNTIRERLDNRYYRRVNSIQWDVRKIETNAARYNELKSEIVKKAILLCEVILEFINDTECTNPMPIYKRLERDRNQSALDDTMNSSIYNIRSRTRNVGNYNENSDNEAMNQSSSRLNRSVGRPSKKSVTIRAGSSNQSRHSRRKVAETDSWIQECKALIDSIYDHPDGEVFIDPVNIDELPNYYEVIENPISFSEIREKLERNQYAELEAFDADCKLLFQNSKTYNTQKRSKIYVMTQRLSNMYNSRIADIRANHDTAIEHEAAMLDKYNKTRLKKIKHNTSLNTSTRSTRHNRILNNSELFSDQFNSPNFNNSTSRLATRSSDRHKKTKTTSEATLPGTSKSANNFDRSFDDIDNTSQQATDNLDDMDTDPLNNAKVLSSPDNSPAAQNISVNNRKKRNVLNSDTDSESNYKSALSHQMNSKGTRASTKSSFKIEPNQNANMGYTSEENSGQTSKDVKLSFSDVLPRKSDAANSNGAISSKHHLNITKFSSSECEDVPASHSKASGKSRPGRKAKRLVSEQSEDGEEEEDEKPVSSGRRSTRASRLDDTMEDEDELYGPEAEEDDDKDGDYSVSASRSSRTKGKGRGRPKKNFDDKENEDDFIDNSSYTEKYKSGSSSKLDKKKKKSSKRSRTSTRNRKQTNKYKEETSSAENSEATSANTTESDESIDHKKTNNSNHSKRHRQRKKARRDSSQTDNSEVSPVRRGGKKQNQNNTFEDDEAPESDFDPYSNDNSRHNSSRLSSRGRLLKTVPQY